MSSTEILAIVFGLFLGYLLVGQFLTGKKHKIAQAQSNQEPSHRHEGRANREAGQDRRPAEDARPSSQPWHEVLNISRTAEIDEIKRAYRSMMSQYHPDKVAALGPELQALCERKAKQINKAYDQAIAEQEGVR